MSRSVPSKLNRLDQSVVFNQWPVRILLSFLPSFSRATMFGPCHLTALERVTSISTAIASPKPLDNVATVTKKHFDCLRTQLRICHAWKHGCCGRRWAIEELESGHWPKGFQQLYSKDVNAFIKGLPVGSDQGVSFRDEFWDALTQKSTVI